MSTELAHFDQDSLASIDARLRVAQDVYDIQQEGLNNLRSSLENARGEIDDRPARYQSLCTAVANQYTTVMKMEETIQRLKDIRGDLEYWRSRKGIWKEKLLGTYEGRGPQYEILIERLVFAEIQVEQLEHSGRVYDKGEWRAANRAVLDAVQALQKYTESMKTEQIQQAQQKAMLVVIDITQQFLQRTHPELFVELLDEIHRRIPDGRLIE